MRDKLWFVARGLAVLVLLGTVSCGSDDADQSGSSSPVTAGTGSGTSESDTTAPSGEPQRGGNLVYLSSLDFGTADPAAKATLFTISDQVIFNSIFDSLVWVDADGTITPRLAESVTSQDGLTWVIKLREGVQFSDGTPFDADAVKFNWDRHLDPAVASACQVNAAALANVAVDDPTTITVTLAAPDVVFPRSLMDSCLSIIGSPTAIKAKGPEFGHAPVGAGPYVLSEWVIDDHMTVTRNDKYWNKPEPYLDQLEYRIVPDDQQRADTFRSGDAKAVFFNAGPIVADLVKDDSVHALPTGDIWGGYAYVFNMTKPPLDDVRVRRAFGLAIDFDQLNDSVYNGTLEPRRTLFPESSPFYEDIPLPFDDPAAAQKLMDEYKAEKGGPAKITILASEGATAAEAEAIAQMVNEVDGFEVNVEVTTGQENSRRRGVKDFMVSLQGISGVDPQPSLFNTTYSKGARNFTGFNNPKVDAALQTGRSSLDPKVRKDAYRVVQEELQAEVPFVIIHEIGLITVLDNSVHATTYGGGGYFDFGSAWLEDD